MSKVEWRRRIWSFGAEGKFAKENEIIMSDRTTALAKDLTRGTMEGTDNNARARRKTRVDRSPDAAIIC